MKGVIMESYIITYDLKYSSNNYDDLIDKIKNYPKWAHVNESVWIVKSNTSAEDIRIDEEVQGERIGDLNTEQLIKQVVKNIDDDVISVEIKKRHRSDEF